MELIVGVRQVRITSSSLMSGRAGSVPRGRKGGYFGDGKPGSLRRRNVGMLFSRKDYLEYALSEV